MKKYILIILTILGINVCKAQTYNIYNTNNGIKSINPEYTISPTVNEAYNIYHNTNGIPDINPTYIVQPTNNYTSPQHNTQYNKVDYSTPNIYLTPQIIESIKRTNY